MGCFRSDARKCQEALTVLAAHAEYDLAAYQVLANIVSTNSEVLKSAHELSAREKRKMESPSQHLSPHPSIIPRFV